MGTLKRNLIVFCLIFGFFNISGDAFGQNKGVGCPLGAYEFSKYYNIADNMPIDNDLGRYFFTISITNGVIANPEELEDLIQSGDVDGTIDINTALTEMKFTAAMLNNFLYVNWDNSDDSDIVVKLTIDFPDDAREPYVEDYTISRSVFECMVNVNSKPSATALCSSEEANFGISPSGYTNYDWYVYDKSDTSPPWKKITGPGVSNSALNFNMGTTYLKDGKDFTPQLNTEYQVKVCYEGEKPCEVIGTYIFYPKPPEVDTVYVTGPTCIGGDGSVTIEHTSIDQETGNAVYYYTLTKFTERVSDDEPCYGEDDGFTPVEMKNSEGDTVKFCTDGSSVYNAKNTGKDLVFELNSSAFLNSEEPQESVSFSAGAYKLEIETAIFKTVDGIESKTETCSIYETFFYVDDPEPRDITDKTATIPSCLGSASAPLADAVISFKVDRVNGDIAGATLNGDGKFYIDNPFSEGSQSIVLEDGCGTPDNISFSINVEDGPPLDIVVDAVSHPVCNIDGPDGTVSVTVSPITLTGYKYFIDKDDGTGERVVVEDEGSVTNIHVFDELIENETYKFSVSAEGCALSEDKDETMGSIPTVTLDVDVTPATCSGEQGSINISNIQKGNGTTEEINISYFIHPTGTTTGTEVFLESYSNINPEVDPGSYTVSFTDNCGGSSITSKDVQVGGVTELGVNITSVNPYIINCGDGVDGSMEFNITGGTAPFTATITNGDNLVITGWNITGTEDRFYSISNLPSGVYSIAVQETGEDCNNVLTPSVNAEVQVRNNADPITYSSSVPILGDENFNLICSNDVTFAEITIVGGYLNGNNYDVSLKDSDEVSYTNPIACESPTDNCFKFIDLPSGIYHPIVIDENPCTKDFSDFEDTFTITEPAALLTIADIDTVDFADDQIKKYAIDGLMYTQCNDESFTFQPSVGSIVSGGVGSYAYKIGAESDWETLEIIWDDETSLTKTFVVTDDNGCVASQNFTIINPGSLVFEEIKDVGEYDHGESVQCYYDSEQGEIYAKPIRGIGEYKYFFEGVHDTIADGLLEYTFDSLNIDPVEEVTSYRIYVQDDLGCQTESVEVNLTLPDSVKIINLFHTPAKYGSVDIACKTDSAELEIDISGGYILSNYSLFVLSHPVTLLEIGDTVDIESIGSEGVDNYLLPTGNYWMMAIDDYSCKTHVESSLTLTEPTTRLTITDTTITPPNCIFDDVVGNEHLGTIEFTAAGGTEPTGFDYTFELLDESTKEELLSSTKAEFTESFNASANGIATRQYIVKVTDVNGCTDSEIVTMGIDETPIGVVISSSTPPSCHDGTNGEITFDITDTDNDDGPYNFILSGGQLADDVTVSEDTTATQYTFTGLSDTNNDAVVEYVIFVEDKYGCTEHANVNTISTQLIAPALLEISPIGIVRPSFESEDDGMFIVKAKEGTKTGYMFSLNGTDFTSSPLTGYPSYWPVEGRTEGDYTVYLRDSSYTKDLPASQHEFCQKEFELNIPAGRKISLVETVSIPISCKDGDDGQIAPVFTLENAVESIDYNSLIVDWEKKDGSLDGSATDGSIGIDTIKNLPAGSYGLIATYDFNNIYNYTSDFEYSYQQTASEQTADFIISLSDPSAIELDYKVYPVSCGGTADGSITFKPSGGWPTVNKQYRFDGGAWEVFNGQEQVKIEGLAVGFYDISIGLPDGGCTTDYSFEITERALDIAVGQVVHPNSFGIANGSVTLSTTVDDEVNFYRVVGADYFPCLAGYCGGLGAGVHSFVAQRDGVLACVSVIIQETLTEPDELVVDAVETHADCGQNNGTATAAITGGVAPYVVFWENLSGIEIAVDSLVAGRYVLVVQDANLTLAKDTFDIADIPGIEINDLVVAPADCTYPNGEATFTITDGHAPYEVQGVSYLDATIGLTDLYAGDTVVYITDSRGCSTEVTLTIPDQGTILQPVVSKTATTCATTNGEIEMSTSGGTAPYTYRWSGSDENSNVLSGLMPGSYTAYITDAHGCEKEVTEDVIASDGIQNVEWETTSPYCGISEGTITVTGISGDFSPFDIYLETATDTTFQASHTDGDLTTISSLSAGTYSLAVYDANACLFRVNDMTLTDDPDRVPTYAWEIIQESACGQATGSIEVSPETGIGPFGYAWYDEDDQDLSIGVSQGTSLAAGNYHVVTTDGAGCAVAVSVVMEDREAPAINLTARSTSPVGAANGTITIALSGGGGAPYLYQLEESTNNDTGYFEQLGPDTYDLFGTDSDGCRSDTIAVNILGTEQLDIMSIGTSAATCSAASDGSIQVKGSGGIAPYTYYLSGALVDETITGLATGDYWVKTIDDIGSVDSVAVFVPVLTPISVIPYTTKVSCEGYCDGTINLTIAGGSGGYQISWSDGAEGTDRSGLCPGDYVYEIIDDRNNACNASATITIGEEPYLALNLVEANAPTCYDGNNGELIVSAQGGSQAYDYTWDTGNKGTKEVSQPGAYTVTVLDTYLGCTAVETYTIPNQEPILVTANITQPSCFGSATGAIALSLENAPSSLVRWSDGQIGMTATNLIAGTYSYVIKSTLGCDLSGEVVVTERERLAATTTLTDNICFGYCQGAMSLNITGGVTPYRVAWSHGSSSLNPINLCEGTYDYTIVDAYGCAVEGSVTILEPEKLEITAANITDVSCRSGENGAVDISLTGGTGDYVSNWSNAATSKDLEGVIAGEYSVRISDENGCEVAGAYEVEEPDPLTVISFTGVAPSCTGYADGTLAITPYGGTAPYRVVWDNTRTGVALEGLAAGRYTATITDANGCTLDRDWVLSDPTGMQFGNVSFNDPVCHDDTNGAISFAVVGGNGTYQYDWDHTEGANTVDNLLWGAYTVVASDEEGCDITRTFTLDNPEIPVLLGVDEYYIMCTGGQMYLAPTEEWASYAWTGPEEYYSEEKVAGISAHGEYELTVTNDLGCLSSVETFVEVSDNPLDPDFIRISEAVTFEPIIFVDLSLPLPERVNWLLPDHDAIVVNEQSELSMELVFTEPGTYEIGMEVGMSNCVAEIFKTVTVEDGSATRQLISNDREKNPMKVKIWPNPTAGEIQLIFNVKNESPLEVQLIGANHTTFRTATMEGKKDYLVKW
ncbi:MAG: SprB repeat-containing protein, partial [Reichenbachiella sp.]